MRAPAQITETERENGSNAYLMTLVAAIAGLPLPIINLLACIIFAVSMRKKSDFVRYHILQATLSQAALVMMNTVLFTWSLRIFFSDLEISRNWVAYLIAAVTLNILDYISNIRAAIAARKGVHYQMAFFGWLSWYLVYRKKQDSSEPIAEGFKSSHAFMQAGLLIALFMGVFFSVQNFSSAWIPKVNVLTSEKEIELGEKITTLYLEDKHEIRSAAAVALLDTIQRRLNMHASGLRYPYHIYIIEKDEINAITLPGGNIIVFSGLIKETESPEELMGVIAHEAGHVELNHITSRIIRDIGIGVLINAAGGGNMKIIHDVLQSAIGNTFNRTQEEEADNYALKLLEKSRIDPKVLGTFFQRISKQEADSGSNFDPTEFLSTHPSEESRIAKAFAYKTGSAFKPQQLPLEDYEKLKENVN